jgi:hypothetical protein
MHPSAQTRTSSGRSSAASGAATITGVPAVGLPKMTGFVSRSSGPSFVASPRVLCSDRSPAEDACAYVLAFAEHADTDLARYGILLRRPPDYGARPIMRYRVIAGVG